MVQLVVCLPSRQAVRDSIPSIAQNQAEAEARRAEVAGL